MSLTKQEIGWKPFWYMLRGYQLLVVLLAVPIGVMKPPQQPHEIVLIVLVAIVILLVFDMFAHGTANERGITFQRYRDEQFVPWRDVEEVKWSPKAIQIKLRDRHFLRRYLYFPLRSGVRDGLAFAFGRPVAEPAFVAWLKQNGYLNEEAIRMRSRWRG